MVHSVCMLNRKGMDKRSQQLRDWSLITGRGGGGATKREGGGHVKFYP